MMTIYRSRILQDSPQTLLARVVDESGNLITANEISAIDIQVTDLISGPIQTTTADPMVAVYSSLQTDSKWTADSIGYNVEIYLDGLFFPSAPTTYQVEARFYPVADEYGPDSSFLAVWQMSTVRTFS